MGALAKPPTTVRVRILAAIDHHGQWIAHGHSAWAEKDFRAWLWSEGIHDGTMAAYRWIEADIIVHEGPAEPITGSVRTADLKVTPRPRTEEKPVGRKRIMSR